MSIFSSEPAVILAAIGAIFEAAIVLAISFGAPITGDQKAALNAFITLVITCVTGVIIRSQVTPTSHVVATIHDTVIPPVTPPV